MCKQFFQLAQRLRTMSAHWEWSENRVSAVALLIDGENISADFAVHLLAYAGRFGGVSVCRVYGNWAAPTMQRWQEMATHYGMTPEHQHLPVAGKNATDIALAVDAIDLFYRGTRRFCLASGDSDYTPLVRWLVEQGCLVVVIGRPDTAPTLQQACTVFVSTEQLQLTPSRAKNPPTPIPSSAPGNEYTSSSAAFGPANIENADLQRLLMAAYNRIVDEKGNAWVALAQLGAVLHELDPDFDPKNYGSPKLKELIRKYAPVFLVQETGTGQAQVKLKTYPDEPDPPPENEIVPPDSSTTI